jgi:hypothetical protein
MPTASSLGSQGVRLKRCATASATKESSGRRAGYPYGGRVSSPSVHERHSESPLLPCARSATASEAATITGQVVDAEGGFRRSTP